MLSVVDKLAREIIMEVNVDGDCSLSLVGVMAGIRSFSGTLKESLTPDMTYKARDQVVMT